MDSNFFPEIDMSEGTKMPALSTPVSSQLSRRDATH